MPRPQVGIEQISLFPLESLTSSKKSLVMDALLFGPKKEAERLARNRKEFHFLSRLTDPKTSKVAAEKAVTFKQTHIDRIYETLKLNGKMNFQEIAQ